MTQAPLIAFLGAGNMGEAMLRGLRRSGHPAERLRAFDTRAEHLQALAREAGFSASPSPAEAVQGADAVVLAVKPQVFDAVLAGVAPLLRPGQTVVSIAAGVRLERMAKALAPGIALVRVMPNTPGLIGQGVSAFCLSGGLDGGRAAAVSALAQSLLSPLGQSLLVDEADMDAVTALSGSGPAYVFLFMEALQAAGTGLGLDPETSFLLASRTLSGAASMIQAGDKPPAQLRAAVTSPGGTTAAALKVLEDGGFRGLVQRALDAARDRSRELGRGA